MASALILLPTSSTCLPRPNPANGPFRLGRRSDSDSGSILVVIFSAIILVALAYALAIGWEKTKLKPDTQSEQTQSLSDHESPPEIAQGGERVCTPTAERSLCVE
jgi:hypothetical protein